MGNKNASNTPKKLYHCDEISFGDPNDNVINLIYFAVLLFYTFMLFINSHSIFLNFCVYKRITTTRLWAFMFTHPSFNIVDSADGEVLYREWGDWFESHRSSGTYSTWTHNAWLHSVRHRKTLWCIWAISLNIFLITIIRAGLVVIFFNNPILSFKPRTWLRQKSNWIVIAPACVDIQVIN